MGKFDIFDTIDATRKTGRPFSVATVLRTADVTSAKAGAKAVVTEQGEILGHLGGGCVQGAVRRAAAEALAAGEPRMIRVKPSEKVVTLTDEDGAAVYKSGCPSGGTVDLLIEPYTLPPQLLILGNTPISRAIAAHGALAGYRVIVPQEMEFAEAPGAVDAIIVGTDFGVEIAPTDFVVVASQGARDLDCLRAALDSPARRVSMVASRRKAEVLCGKLLDQGMAEARVRRLKSPAGLDLKAIDPQEIALSVLAEIVLWRNADRETGGDRDENSA